MTKRTNRLSRMLVVTLAVMMILTGMNFGMGGGTTLVWAETIPSGDGTEAAPYQISTADELLWFADQVNKSAKKSTSMLWAKLTGDIDLKEVKTWTPIGNYNSYSDYVEFGGVFDGAGHRIYNLTIDNTKAYQALFGRVNGGTIKNLTVKGSITTSTTSTAYAAGIVAYGNSATVENCTNEVHVTATQKGYVAGVIAYASASSVIKGCKNTEIISGCGDYVGGICANASKSSITNCMNSGAISNSGKPASYAYCTGGIVGSVDTSSISMCGNTGTITSTLKRTGGIAGSIGSYGGGGSVDKSFNTGAITGIYGVGGIVGDAAGKDSSISDCYNQGNVTAQSPTPTFSDTNAKGVGGIIGGVSSNTITGITLSNCYSTGNITSTSTLSDITCGGVIGNSSGKNSKGVETPRLITAANTYYLTGGASQGDGANADATGITAKTEGEMKTEDFANNLQGAFIAQKGKYPLLGWEDPNAQYQVVFTLSPEDASLTVRDATNTAVDPSTEGTHTFSLKNGTYKYEVSADEHTTKTGSFTVAYAGQNISVSLDIKKYDFTFTTVPTDAQLTVDGQKPLVDGRTYQLPKAGTPYQYTVDAFGYEAEQGNFTIAGESAQDQKTVTLIEQAKHNVNFSYTKEKGGQTSEVTVSVKSKDYPDAAITAESQDNSAAVFALPNGAYTYKISSAGYKSVSGEFTVQNNGVTVPAAKLDIQTAWDGSTYDEPNSENGIYLIHTASELMWFNQNAQLTDSAKLMADIRVNEDMSSADKSTLYKWTPIGTASSKAYAGTFDGNGHTLSGIYIATTTSNTGLIGYMGVDGRIKNLTMADSNINATGNYCGAFVGDSKGNIENCHTRSDVIVSGAGYVGGITGSVDGSASLEQCSNAAKVIASAKYVGGITGEVYSTSTTAVSKSYNIGSVQGANWVGGIAGTLYSGGTIINVYNVGSVTANKVAGSLVGRVRAGSIQNTYTAGTLEGETKGAIIGDLEYANGAKSLTNVFYQAGIADEVVGDKKSCTIQNGTAESKSEEELKNLAAELGEAFAEDEQNLNRGYPVLAWQTGKTTEDDKPDSDPKGWDGKTATKPTLVGDVYQIGTAAELKWFANAVANKHDINAVLTADIDLNNQEWKAIGGSSAEAAYAGTFDGDGKKIKNLYLKNEKGLFAYNIGSISNLQISGLLKQGDNAAALVGVNAGIIKQITTNVTVTAGNIVAGIAAVNEASGTITNCLNIGNITGGQYVAGIVAKNKGTVTQCDNAGMIKATGAFAAGIAAANDEGRVSQCANNGHILSTAAVRSAYVGGCIGWNNGNADHLYNAGNIISMGSAVGGCIGVNLSNCTSSYVYNEGEVVGAYQNTEDGREFRVGGVIGSGNGENMYYLADLAIVKTGTKKGEAVSAEQLKQLAGDLPNGLPAKEAMSGTLSVSGQTEVLQTVTVTCENSNVTAPIFVWYWMNGEQEQVATVAESFEVPVELTGKVLGVKAFDAALSGMQSKQIGTIAGFSGTVAIQGIAAVGHTIKAVYAGEETAPTFQWYRGTTKITDANTAEYTITSADLGKVLSVRVSGSKAGYIEANTAGIKTEAELGIWPENACSEPQLSENVYQIGTVAELKWFVNRVNAGETSLSAKLTKDIDISSDNWYPIGITDGYSGTFDGSGKTIKYALTASDKAEQGFFAVIEGTGIVKNLIVDGTVKISGNNAEYVGGIAGNIKGRILDCKVKGTVEAANMVGGIAGVVDLNAQVKNCLNEAAISGKSQIGGIAGTNSYGKINYCVNKGGVSATADFAGGIAGQAVNYAEITACYNTGAIAANKNIGGIVGKVYVACAPQGCYNIGSVSIGINAGAVMGEIDGTDYIVLTKGSFYREGDSVQDANAKAVKEASMKTDSFVNRLNMETGEMPFVADTKAVNSGYPILKWEAGIKEPEQGGGTTPDDKAYIDVSFSLIGDTKHGTGAHTGETWINRVTFSGLKKGSTAYDVFKAALQKEGYTYTATGAGYVSGITTPAGFTLKEFDNGPRSGWMYTINNVFPDYMPVTTLKDGDNMVFFYVDDYNTTGWDPNGKPGDSTYNPTNPETKSDVTTSGASGSATTTAPTDVKVSEKTNADGTKETIAAVKVDSKHHDEIIKQAAEKKSAEIVLEVSKADSKGADNVQLTLDVTFVKNVADKTNADLTVNTENGKVTLDQETIKTVLGAAKGATITLEVTKVAKPTEAQKKAAGANGHVISLTVKSGNQIISDFNKGKATVMVELVSRLIGKKVAAIHIADDGTIEQLAGKLLTVGGKQYYEFATPHFSTFAIVDADEVGLDAAEEPTVDAKALVSKLTPAARSAKTAKKNVKVTTSLDKQDKEIISQLKDAGYTVKYRFYRSTKKAAGYKAAVTKKASTYTSTSGKKGTKYFYKVQVRVYDASGKLAAKTALKQCRYASRTWNK